MKLPKSFRPKKDLNEKIGELSENRGSDNINLISDYIALKDISCVNSDGNVFEHYDVIYVAKDIMKDSKDKLYPMSIDSAADHFNSLGRGSFLPSFALTCNILNALYEKIEDPDIENILMQYKDFGGHGWHVQNTLIMWDTKEIVHYPKMEDFPSDTPYSNINKNKKSIRLKSNWDLYKKTAWLEDLLYSNIYKDLVTNLTGLENPYIINELAELFGGTSKVLMPDDLESIDYVSSAFLGCHETFFELNFNDDVNTTWAARGVYS